MKNNLFRGVTTALITPFLDDQSVDYEGLRRNVRYQIDGGVQGLLLLGTTGEPPTLTEEEKERIVATAIEEVRSSGKSVKILQGVGTNSTRKTLQNVTQAESAGVDAVLVVTPYYNKPTQEGIYQHFAAIDAEISIPIVVYNIKSRTGTNIETCTMKRISALKHVIAVKEASGDINQMMEVMAEIPELAVYSGDDSMTFPLISLGGQGVISVVSNLFPDKVVSMVDAALDGEMALARKLHFDLLPIFKGAFIETSPAPIKYALSRRGLAGGPLRLPLVEMSQANKARVDNLLETYYPEQ